MCFCALVHSHIQTHLKCHTWISAECVMHNKDLHRKTRMIVLSQSFHTFSHLEHLFYVFNVSPLSPLSYIKMVTNRVYRFCSAILCSRPYTCIPRCTEALNY